MKVRAAVLEEFAAPLQVQQPDLAKPKTAEVLVRLARPPAAAASRF